MQYIENQIYYHIQRAEPHKPSFWELGFSTFIGDSKNPFSYNHDIAGFHRVNADNIVDVLVHYQQYSRECIFEEVRLKHFSNFPSRLNCLWVIPDEEESIEFWKNELSENRKYRESRLLRLNLTGKIHKANQSFLELNFRPLNFNREQAFKYWNGSSGNGSKEDEFLFQGIVEVLEVTNL